MPTITIYLTKEQYDKVCDAPSKAVQAALDYYFENGNGEPTEAPECLRGDGATPKETETSN